MSHLALIFLRGRSLHHWHWRALSFWHLKWSRRMLAQWSLLNLTKASILTFVLNTGITLSAVRMVNKFKKLMDNQSQVRMILEVRPFKGPCLHCFVLFKVCLVDCFFHLYLPDFFDFIVINHQSLSFKNLSVQVHSCTRCCVWNSEANERKCHTILSFVNSNSFNLSKL